MGLLDELSSIIVTPAPGTSDGGGGGGGDPTNLNSVEAPSTVTITSSTGTNAVIPAADASNAGVFLPTEKDKLTNIAAGATANSTDAFLLDRTNHTGTQAQSTIVGLATTLGLKADLVDGVVPANQLPAFVDDVLEFANFAALPVTGEAGKIYVTLDDNRQYRWSGSAYVQLNGGLALGETSATAYRGDRGKIAYDHSQIVSGNPHNTTTGDISEVADKRFLTDAERTAITTNSSKVTNASHTGDVTGSSELTIQPVAVSGKTVGTPTGGDIILFARGGVLYSGDVAAFLAGGSGTTNLAYTAAPTNGIVTSSTGTDATLTAANGTNAGLFLPAEKTKLAGIESSAEANIEHGLILGGALSINTDTTKFDIEDGVGRIVDEYTDPLNPVRYNVSWTGLTAQTVTNLATSSVTYVLIDNAGGVVQLTSFPTEEQRRDNIFLGQLGHSSNTSIGASLNTPDIAASPISQLRDYAEGIGPINAGNVLSPNGANLQLNKSAGSIIKLGSNHDVNIKAPTKKTIGGYVAFDFRYRTQTGIGSTVNAIDPNSYDNAGTITALPANKYTNQRAFLATNGNVVIQYGQIVYSSFSDAVTGVQADAANFVRFENVDDNFVLIGVITVARGATDLSDPGDAKFFQPSKFGETVGAVAGTSVTNLQQAYQNSPDPEISTIAPLTFRAASGSNANNVFEVQNIAGTVTFAVTGAGAASFASLTIGGDAQSGINSGDQAVFQTIAVAGQSDVVADTAADTVTFVNGTNTTITTNAATKTITFNSTAAGMIPVEVNNAASPYAAVDKQIIGALSSTGAITINLPASGTAAVINVKDKSFQANVNTVTITPNGADTINGQASITLTTAGAYVGLALAAGSTDWDMYFFDDNVDTTIQKSKNRIVNGGFSIDQLKKGLAATVVAGDPLVYNIDFWGSLCTGANVTGQRIAEGSNDFRYRYTGATSNTQIKHIQRIEAADTKGMNGSTCSLSLKTKNSLLTTVGWQIHYANTKDIFSAVTLIDSGTFTVTSTEAYYSAQIAIPAIASTGIQLTLFVDNQVSGTWDIGDVQFEVGTPTDFEIEPRSVTIEKCQWRYEPIGGGTTVVWSGDITLGATYYADLKVRSQRGALSLVEGTGASVGFSTVTPGYVTPNIIRFEGVAAATGTGYIGIDNLAIASQL